MYVSNDPYNYVDPSGYVQEKKGVPTNEPTSKLPMLSPPSYTKRFSTDTFTNPLGFNKVPVTKESNKPEFQKPGFPLLTIPNRESTSNTTILKNTLEQKWEQEQERIKLEANRIACEEEQSKVDTKAQAPKVGDLIAAEQSVNEILLAASFGVMSVKLTMAYTQAAAASAGVAAAVAAGVVTAAPIIVVTVLISATIAGILYIHMNSVIQVLTANPSMTLVEAIAWLVIDLVIDTVASDFMSSLLYRWMMENGGPDLTGYGKGTMIVGGQTITISGYGTKDASGAKGTSEYSYDDYYDNESPTSERVGKQNSNAPRNNKNQNEQFNAVVKALGLTAEAARKLHEEITGQGYSYRELLEYAKEMFNK